MRGLFFVDELQRPSGLRQVLENKGLLQLFGAPLSDAWRISYGMRRDAASKRMPRKANCSTVTSMISMSREDKGRVKKNIHVRSAGQSLQRLSEPGHCHGMKAA